MEIGICVPVHKDTYGKWRTIFCLKFIGSCHHLHGLSGFCLLLNFQDFSEKEAAEFAARISKKTALPVLYDNKCYKKPVSMAKIREDIAALKVCDAYVIVDDDFVWGSNTTTIYQKARTHFMQDKKCGVLMVKGIRKTQHFGYDVLIGNHARWWTSRGVFLRRVSNVPWLLGPHDNHHLSGGFEEIYFIWSRFMLGFHGAQIYNSNIYHRISISIERWHKEMKKQSLIPITVIGRYDVAEDMHNPNNCTNNLQFLRNYFQITNKEWPFEKEPHIPAFVQDSYIKHGGKPSLMLQKKFIKYEESI